LVCFLTGRVENGAAGLRHRYVRRKARREANFFISGKYFCPNELHRRHEGSMAESNEFASNSTVLNSEASPTFD
jgi:hypothetical protein